MEEKVNESDKVITSHRSVAFNKYFGFWFPLRYVPELVLDVENNPDVERILARSVNLKWLLDHEASYLARQRYTVAGMLLAGFACKVLFLPATLLGLVFLLSTGIFKEARAFTPERAAAARHAAGPGARSRDLGQRNIDPFL